MISKIKFTSGFPVTADNLTHLRDRTFKFTDGLNALFGSNGTGKSVILNTIKSYSCVPGGGWSRILDPSTHGGTTSSHWPFCLRAITPGNCDAIVRWDGMPTFFNGGEISVDNTFFWDTAKQSEDGLTDAKSALDIMAAKPSSGQYRTLIMNRILTALKTPPDLTQMPNDIQDKAGAHQQIQYISGLSREGKITILMDEPERALSLPRQRDMFKMLEKLSETYQIIVATHSPMILGTDANIIDVSENGYVDECVTIMKDFGKGLKAPKKKSNKSV